MISGGASLSLHDSPALGDVQKALNESLLAANAARAELALHIEALEAKWRRLDGEYRECKHTAQDMQLAFAHNFEEFARNTTLMAKSNECKKIISSLLSSTSWPVTGTRVQRPSDAGAEPKSDIVLSDNLRPFDDVHEELHAQIQLIIADTHRPTCPQLAGEGMRLPVSLPRDERLKQAASIYHRFYNEVHTRAWAALLGARHQRRMQQTKMNSYLATRERLFAAKETTREVIATLKKMLDPVSIHNLAAMGHERQLVHELQLDTNATVPGEAAPVVQLPAASRELVARLKQARLTRDGAWLRLEAFLNSS